MSNLLVLLSQGIKAQNGWLQTFARNYRTACQLAFLAEFLLERKASYWSWKVGLRNSKGQLSMHCPVIDHYGPRCQSLPPVIGGDSDSLILNHWRI